jgi:hypothetical protein
MSLKKIAIIVDGPTEEGSLRSKFEKQFFESPSIRIGPGNGITFSLEGYAKGVLPTLQYLLKSTVRAIILIPDFENRKGKCERFSENLKKNIIKILLRETKYKEDDLKEVIYVCPPNKMFENWIIADVDGIIVNNSLINPNANQKNYEGMHGASELQKIMTTKYKKTVHAQMLFKKIRDDISIANSSSYESFISCFENLRQKHCQ